MTKQKKTPEQRALISARRAANKAAKLARANAATTAGAADQPNPAAPKVHDGDDDGYITGYCKPPREWQFKPGISGCEDGGWEQRRANEAAAQAAEAAKKHEKSMADEVRELFERRTQILINGELTEVSALTALLYRDQVAAATDDKIRERLLRRAERLDLLKAPPKKERHGVVVIGRRPSKDEWLKMAANTKLPLDPLEGLPGIPANLDRTKGRTTDTSDDDQV